MQVEPRDTHSRFGLPKAQRMNVDDWMTFSIRCFSKLQSLSLLKILLFSCLEKKKSLDVFNYSSITLQNKPFGLDLASNHTIVYANLELRLAPENAVL